MDAKFALLQKQLESLIASSDSIHGMTKQSTFNRMIPLSDLGMVRATKQLKEKVILWCNAFNLDAVYSDVSRAFHFTLDVHTVRRTLNSSSVC